MKQVVSRVSVLPTDYSTQPFTDKPFSQACENNKQAILDVLQCAFNYPASLLEIGSGTGQHAAFFARNLAHLNWYPSDLRENIDGINLWLAEETGNNLNPPVVLDVKDHPWPFEQLEAVFTANTLHIMSWPDVEILFSRLGEYMQPNAKFCSYGPYNKNGLYTSESNARFDLWLKQQNPESAIRHIEDLVKLGNINNIQLIAEVTMPANNMCLLWQKGED